MPGLKPADLYQKGVNKKQISNELKQRSVEFDESETFENLRELLKRVLKKEIETEKEISKSEKLVDSEGVESEKHESDKNSTMSDENVKIQFCLEKDDWKVFTKRLAFYFISKKVEDDKLKVATLLTRVDEEAFKLFEQLVAPAELETKKYEDLIKAMTDHLQPKPSQAMERCTFHQAKQEPSESVTEFITRLKKLSMNCGFTDVNEKLCDQLVCGLQDKETKIRLFEQEKLTYEDAVKIAKARESAVKNAVEAQSTLERKNPNSEVYMLRKENKGNAQQKKRANRQGQSNRNIECYCCGKPNHISRECRYKELECNFCKRKGHLERACRSKQNQRKTKSSVNLLQEESSETKKKMKFQHTKRSSII